MAKKFWIKSALKHKGLLHRDLHVAKGKRIPLAMLKLAAHHPGKLGQRARFALTLRGFKHKKTRSRRATHRHTR